MNKYDIVKKHIDEYDYYNLLACHAPSDEFDSYSHKLAQIITENDTVEHIATLLADTLDKAFGEDVNPVRYMETAQKIKTDLNGIW